MFAQFGYNDQTFINVTPAELLAAGVPQESIDEALAAERLAAIKAECRRRIYSVASAETQMNMATASAAIAGKTAATRTDKEKATLAGVQASLAWVQAMKAAVVTLASDPALDPADDASWPDCPANVLAVVEQF